MKAKQQVKTANSGTRLYPKPLAQTKLLVFSGKKHSL